MATAADAITIPEEAEGTRLDVFLAWTPLDRLTLALDVPFAHNRIEEVEGGDSQTHSLYGLGDVAEDLQILLPLPITRETHHRGIVFATHIQVVC